MKLKHLFTLFFVIIISSCTTTTEKKPQFNNGEANVAVAKQLYVHFNNHEWAKMAELYTDPADFKDPSLGKEIVPQTRQQTIEKYTKLAEMSPDIRDSVVQIYPSGDKHVIVEFISSGTTPDSSKWSLPLCTIFTIENGKITKDYTYYDNE